MKLNEVRAFVAVARTGSVQAAADQLLLTQSAVSRLVQRLESELGAVLFDRQSKPLALTSDGRIALEQGRRLLGASDDFARAFAPMSAPRGTLRVGTAHALAELVADQPLTLLGSLYPDVTLQVSVDWAAPLVAKVEDGDLDAAIITLLTDAPPVTECPSRLLGRDGVSIIGAAHLPARRWGSLAAMNALGWVIQPEGCGYRSALARELDKVGAGAPKVIVESFGRGLMLSVVARGAAFGLLPTSQTLAIRPPRTIKAFAVRDVSLAVSTWIVRGRCPGRLARPMEDFERAIEDRLVECDRNGIKKRPVMNLK